MLTLIHFKFIKSGRSKQDVNIYILISSLLDTVIPAATLKPKIRFQVLWTK